MKDNNKKVNQKISILIIVIATLIISISGATYAYFAIGATNNNTITGTAATASLNLTVTKNSPNTSSTNSGVLVPQLNTYLNSAVTAGCVDANQNIVCEIFTITITNNSSAQVRLNGTLNFSYTSTYTNLYWREMDSATSLGTHTIFKASTNADTISSTANAANANLVSSLSLASKAAKSYYVIIWIEETNGTQNTSDTGGFTGTVKFNAINTSGQIINGITSTITS